MILKDDLKNENDLKMKTTLNIRLLKIRQLHDKDSPKDKDDPNKESYLKNAIIWPQHMRP